MMEAKIREDLEHTKEAFQRIKKIAADWPPDDSSMHNGNIETASRSYKLMYRELINMCQIAIC